MAIRKPTDNTVQYFSALIVGDPGSYKTLLASTAKDCYFLDVEGGAAHTGCWRMTFTPDREGYEKLKQEIRALGRLRPEPDGALTHTVQEDGESHTFPVRTVVIDTLDEAQTLAGFKIGKVVNRYGREDKLRFYGLLLEELRDEIVYPARRINCNVLFIAHTRVYLPDEARQADVLPEVTLALQGSIRDQLPRWFDVILHLIINQDGSRTLLTQPASSNGKHYMAKDRYHMFRGQSFAIHIGEGGKPDGRFLQTLIDRTSGGIKEGQASEAARTVSKIKSEWIAAAMQARLVRDVKSEAELARLKEVLGDAYAQLTPENVAESEALKLRGLQAIQSWREMKRAA